MEKFKFVSDENELSREEAKIEELKEAFSDSNEEKKKMEVIPKTEEEVDIEEFRVKKNPHIGFKARVFLFFIFSLALFVGGCYFLMESVNESKSDKVSYDEIGNISYKVCMKGASHYQDECQQEGRAYISSVTNSVDSIFKYDVSISDNIDYNIKYYVEAKTSIFDNSDNSKLLYSSAENLVDNTPIVGNGRSISIVEDVKIPYKKFNDFVASYKSKYAITTDAKLEVNLYLVEEGKSRKVSGLTMDLGNKTFTVKKDTTTNIKKIVDLENNTWDEYNTVCLIIGVVLLLACLLVIIRLANFVNKAINTKSKYQRTLQTILREYDRIIVDVKDSYEMSKDKVVLELDSFTELVDARDTLGKPIVYEKVNEVKSQFFVEDENKVYKYTLKEADIEEK